ncbi:EAL domain-containing protein [Neobacillus terrae]|uniref:EAL domain-containing protein n=1 Tax=Neobacillus terrae TaxID=3034837 RepID=UPI001FB0BCE3|nr:EAL domain-containing protein [Neobacillus terrae]
MPYSAMRFYPPQFIVRNPVAEGVKNAFNNGCEVAVIVFNIKDIKELADMLGQFQFQGYIKRVKKFFRNIIEEAIDINDIITLHDFYGDGLTLSIRVNPEHHSISEIDLLIKRISREAERFLLIEYPMVPTVFQTGYMFVEKKHYSVQEAVLKAQQQAIAMAEKRIDTEFNEMLFTMTRIVSQKDIRLLAQPIIDVATNKVRAWEMLTRGPKGTVLENPLSLFSIARQTGLLYDLEMIVLEKALQQVRDLSCKQDIFLNCTPLTIGNMRFIRDIKKLMIKYKKISPKQITFEITERDSIEGIKDFNYNIKVLRLMGFRLAVDDTGAGYASLNTISEIMPDIIKIDRSVIQNIDKNSVKESMLKGLLLVAREAGSLVVAEGIENESEASVLSRNNVDLAQGYFYARPAALAKSMAT